MTPENFFNLPLDELVYNTKTCDLFRTTSSYNYGTFKSSDLSNVKPEAMLSIERLDNGEAKCLPLANCGEWEIFSLTASPDSVKIKWLILEVAKLNDFIYSRLK